MYTQSGQPHCVEAVNTTILVLVLRPSYFEAAATEAQRGQVSLPWSHRTAVLQCAGKITGRDLYLASGLWLSICAVLSKVLSVPWNCRQLSNNLQVGFSPKRQNPNLHH